MWLQHRRTLLQAPRSELRRRYLAIITFPFVICTLSVVCLFSVRPAYLWEWFQKIYESYTLLSFAICIMVFMGYDSEVAARAMKENGTPTPWMTTVPFTIFFRPCVSPSFMPAWAVDFAYLLVVQFVYIVPLIGLVQLWMLLDGWSSSSAPVVVGIVSTLIAVQGLFMLYKGTFPVIEHYRPLFKFATIKLIVIVSVIQARIIEAIVSPNASLGAYDDTALANLWQVFLLAIESPFFALLMIKAFPLEELMKHHGAATPKEDVELDTDGKPKQKAKSNKRSSASIESGSPASSEVQSSD